MMPFIKLDGRYDRRYRQSYGVILAAVAAVVLVNVTVALWFVLPAHQKYLDVSGQLDERTAARDALLQQPTVQQAAESDIADSLKVLPKRLLLSQLKTTLREAADTTGVIVVKLSSDGGAEEGTAAALSTDNAASDSSNTSINQTETTFQTTLYGDIHSLIDFVTQMQAEQQLLTVDTIHFTRLEDNPESDANQLLAQLPKWRAGWIAYSLDLSFRAFVLPESLRNMLNP